MRRHGVAGVAPDRAALDNGLPGSCDIQGYYPKMRRLEMATSVKLDPGLKDRVQ